MVTKAEPLLSTNRPKGMNDESKKHIDNYNNRRADDLCPNEWLLKAHVIKGQRFYLVKRGFPGKTTE